jgi:hypothetical protein
MNLQAGLFLIHTAPVFFSSYSMTLETGVFSITSEPVTFTTNSSMVLETGVFTILGGNMAIYGACGSGTVIDALAAEAPYPPPDFFTPVTAAAPTVVLSPDEVFGTSTTDPNSGIYLTYYNTATQTWDDTAYETQYPGETIPLDLKEDVASQTYLYSTYIVALALWNSEYDRQRLFQWPYYWANNVVVAPGSTPGGTENCGCGDCSSSLLPVTIAPANQTVIGGTGVSIDDKFDIGGTQYTVGQMFAMVLSKLAQP